MFVCGAVVGFLAALAVMTVVVLRSQTRLTDERAELMNTIRRLRALLDCDD